MYLALTFSLTYTVLNCCQLHSITVLQLYTQKQTEILEGENAVSLPQAFSLINKIYTACVSFSTCISKNCAICPFFVGLIFLGIQKKT